MILDASAVIAILRQEKGAKDFASVIENDPVRLISAVNYVEAAVVVDGERNPLASQRFDDLMRIAGIEIVPVTEAQAKIARQAYRDFGRGSGHPAMLNFGDCFAFALAAESGEPILYQGEEFAKAGIRRAV
jgi:ribonuclease VapC